MSCRGHHSNAEITSKNTYCAFCCAGKVLNFFFLLLYWGETIETKLKFGCSFSISLTFVLDFFCDFCANCAVKHKVWRHAVIRTSIWTHKSTDKSARFIASQVFRNQHSDQLPVGLLAQLVEHCTGIAEVMDSNPVQAWIFSGLIFITAQVVIILRRSLSYSRLHPQFTYMIFMYSQIFKIFKIFYKAK